MKMSSKACSGYSVPGTGTRDLCTINYLLSMKKEEHC